MQTYQLPNSFGIDPEAEAEVPTAIWTPNGWQIEMRDGHHELQKFDARWPERLRTLWTPYGDVREVGKGRLGLFSRDTGRRIPPPVRGGSVKGAYTLQSTTPFAAPAAVHTFIMAIAAATAALALSEWSISFDGVTASAVPVLVEIVNSTQAGAGTAGVSTVITKVRGRITTGAPPTMGGNYTAEPTTLVSLRRYYIPAFMGLFPYQAPLDREIECDDSGGTIKGLGIRITPPATVNAVGYMEVEANG